MISNLLFIFIGNFEIRFDFLLKLMQVNTMYSYFYLVTLGNFYRTIVAATQDGKLYFLHFSVNQSSQIQHDWITESGLTLKIITSNSEFNTSSSAISMRIIAALNTPKISWFFHFIRNGLLSFFNLYIIIIVQKRVCQQVFLFQIFTL